ncbi:MAG: DUF4342 domain-containing protein [Dehalococcoidia bacterium]
MNTEPIQKKTGFGAWAKRVWAEGNRRHVTVAKDGRNLVDLPLTAVVLGGLLAPWALGGGAVVAVVAGCQIGVNTPVGEPSQSPPEEELPADAQALPEARELQD